MKLSVKRSELLAELLLAQGVAGRGTNIPILAHLLLSADGDRLRISATDLDVSLTSSVPAKVNSPGTIAVQAKKFSEIVRSVASDDLLLSIKDERALLVQSGDARFNIHGLPAIDFPSIPTVEEEVNLEIPLANLQRLIGKVIFAVSGDDSRFQLSGALLKIKSKSVEMVATDGHQLALVELPVATTAAEERSTMVPRKALLELARMSGDDSVSLRIGKNHLAFLVGDREMTCRILEGSFPDYERVISRNNDKSVTIDRKGFLDAIRRVAIMTGDRSRGVRLEFAENAVSIAAANPDLGDASENIACEITGGELKLGLNPDYLGSFLASVDTAKVRLELKDENSQCVGFPVEEDEQGADGGRHLGVVMPMRL